MTAPCKDCVKRFIGCHSTCEDYLEFSKQNEAEREKIHKVIEQAKRKIYMSEPEFRRALHRKVENKVFRQHKR